MIRRTTKNIAKSLMLASVIAFDAQRNAGTAAVTPALAACSKALIATLVKTDTLPAYNVKSPSLFVCDLVEPNAVTVIAKTANAKGLLDKGSCKATGAGGIVVFRSIPIDIVV